MILTPSVKALWCNRYSPLQSHSYPFSLAPSFPLPSSSFSSSSSSWLPSSHSHHYYCPLWTDPRRRSTLTLRHPVRRPHWKPQRPWNPFLWRACFRQVFPVETREGLSELFSRKRCPHVYVHVHTNTWEEKEGIFFYGSLPLNFPVLPEVKPLVQESSILFLLL